MAKYEYIQRAFQSDLKPRARLVLNCLVLHCNKDGECFPSIKTIAAECGYGASTVKRALCDLLEAGYIEKKARFDERKKGGQTSNLYTLLVKQDEPKPQEQAPVMPVTVPTLSCNDNIVVETTVPACDNTVLTRGSSAFFSALRLCRTGEAHSPVYNWTGGQVICVPP